MAGNEKRTAGVWAFGKKYEFKIYESAVALNPSHYNTTPRQKNKIVLHATGGNHPAETVVGGWNQKGGTIGAHYVVERAEHNVGSSHPSYTKVVEVVDSQHRTSHADPTTNDTSIGIEHANFGRMLNPPSNANQFFHYDFRVHRLRPEWGVVIDFQAFQEEQYLAMILLLRYLCIKHRIPRRFLGDAALEKMKWWTNPADALTLNRFRRFRGIISHGNVVKGASPKEHPACPGPAMHRNRLFRGIIDEWWLPVQFDGSDRAYYSGPFDPQPNQPSLFRWQGGQLEKKVFKEANQEALQETKSYFDLDQIESYFRESERADLGGTFPIGTNKVWHGGVHLSPPESNRKIYAAASGTIVAARLGNNPAVGDDDLHYGSQRFVLIRHCVYMKREAGLGGGTRINYTDDPTYVFTLYMHLAPFAQPLDAPHDENPPWFNYWLRHRRSPGDDPNVVLCPDVEVSVGDWLGECGKYLGQRMIHFEVMSKHEFIAVPWYEEPAHDPGTDEIVNPEVINRFVLDRTGNGIDHVDILRAAQDLRVIKSYHKSEWALANANALRPVIRGGQTRDQRWEKLKHFMWVADAVSKYPDLATQLCDAEGMMWHYHPFTFMDYVNRMVLEENREVEEPPFADTNVVMENGYLTRYVNFTSATANDPVRPFDLPQQFEYKFTRRQLACLLPGTHSPGDTPPQATLFHLNLLDLLQDIQIKYGQENIIVNLSHACMGHNTPAHFNQCVIGTQDSLNSHAWGRAVDISPTAKNPSRCKALWDAAIAAGGEFSNDCGAHGGEPSRADISAGAGGVRISTTPAIQQKLERGDSLTATEAMNFILHLELVEG